MLDAVTKGFRAAKHKLTGKAELTEANIDDALRDIRVALLEADVEFNVAKRFLARVKEKAVGEVVATAITDKKGKKLQVAPGDHFIKICHDELEALMGPVDTSLALAQKGERPAGVMMVGLQGSGKTTAVAKLANLLLKRGKKPLMVAADIYRPAAVEQLQQLGQKLDIPVFYEENVKPPDMAQHALAYAGEKNRDVVLYDTAGRLAIDEEMMSELEQLKARVGPENILLVADAMIGQDAVRTAAEFERRLALTGFVLTKLDGDARGGAELSIKEVTGKPIKFIGMGEGLDKLEEFRPEGLASRILGFGDIVGLMKDFEGVVDEKKAEEDAVRMLKGKFDMQDFLDHICVIRKMGSLRDLFEKMPFFPGGLPEGVNLDDKELVKIEAMISSMTKQERSQPEAFVVTSWETITNPNGQMMRKRKGSDYDEKRVKRVAKGSGRKEQEVKELLNKFAMMRQMMTQMGAQSGLLGKIPGFKQIAQMRQMTKAASGIDLNQLMSAAGMPAGERRFSVPKTNVDKNK